MRYRHRQRTSEMRLGKGTAGASSNEAGRESEQPFPFSTQSELLSAYRGQSAEDLTPLLTATERINPRPILRSDATQSSLLEHPYWKEFPGLIRSLPNALPVFNQHFRRDRPFSPSERSTELSNPAGPWFQCNAFRDAKAAKCPAWGSLVTRSLVGKGQGPHGDNVRPSYLHGDILPAGFFRSIHLNHETASWRSSCFRVWHQQRYRE